MLLKKMLLLRGTRSKEKFLSIRQKVSQNRGIELTANLTLCSGCPDDFIEPQCASLLRITPRIISALTSLSITYCTWTLRFGSDSKQGGEIVSRVFLLDERGDFLFWFQYIFRKCDCPNLRNVLWEKLVPPARVTILATHPPHPTPPLLSPPGCVAWPSRISDTCVNG